MTPCGRRGQWPECRARHRHSVLLLPVLPLVVGTIMLCVLSNLGPDPRNEAGMSPTLRRSTLGYNLALALLVAPIAYAQDVVASGYGHPDMDRPRFDESYAGPYVFAASLAASSAPVPRPTELIPSAWGYGAYGIPTATGIRPAPVGTPSLYVIDKSPGARHPARNPGPRVLLRGGRTPASTSLASQMQTGAKIVTLRPGRHASR